MKTKRQQPGFSLIEVNMAVFVVAVGVLSMCVLFPLGLRESTQGQADLKQAMFADYVLNQAVAAASQTNIPWSSWRAVTKLGGNDRVNMDNSTPDFIRDYVNKPPMTGMKDTQYKIACCLVPGASDKIMGIMVQSTDLKKISEYNQFSNNTVFYAEVMFQGDPNL